MLTQLNNSLRVDMSSHSDISLWFQTNQSLFFVLNGVCFEEKQQIKFLLSGLNRRISNPRSTAFEESTLIIIS